MKKWSPAEATEEIRNIACSKDLRMDWTFHAKKRMSKRDLLIGDIQQLLKSGFVYEEAIQSTRNSFWKYKVEGTTPNSGSRTVIAIVIPGKPACIKIITVMWKDER